ncbi:MAG: hypothetical protein PHI12_05975 [Dehalococcoidales bacterium]|nr:hypothetical protein [Dehalococcoidales bacterium]
MNNGWEDTVKKVSGELCYNRTKALNTAGDFDLLCRLMEALKIDIISTGLERQRKSMARNRGITLIDSNNPIIQTSMAIVGIGSAIWGGFIGKDVDSAFNAGTAGVDGLIQGLGETKWYVSLTNNLVIAPQDAINQNGIWVSLERINAVLEQLKKRAIAGEQLGGFSNIINRLKQSFNRKVMKLLPRCVTE